jgi:cell division initiation protein
MELTPNEMRNHQFSSSFRGFNRAEVGAFKESAATTLEEARAQIQKLSEENELLSAKYNELKNLEETIKSAMLEAQKNSDQITTNARKEAELIIGDAKNRRDKAIEEKYNNLAELEAKIKKLEFTKKSFYTKLRSEMEAHLKLVDSIMPPDKIEKAFEESSQAAPRPAEPYAQSVPAEEMRPDEPQPEAEFKPKRPSLDMPDDEIDRVIDQFGEESQEEEEVKDGQPQGNDY